MSNIKSIVAAGVISLAAFGIAACEDGAAENAGETIDEAIHDAGNEIEDACEDIKDGVNAKDTDC